MVNKNIPYEDFGGKGRSVHIAHANGFPAGCYSQLADHLSSSAHVVAMNARPMWKGYQHNMLRSWYPMADDLIRFLDEHHFKAVIGVGHSFGSIITILAANKRPDLFSQLILLEPVVLPSNLQAAATYAPISLIKRLSPTVRAAVNRTEYWPDRQAAFDHFRTKPVFASVPDQVLWDYVNFGTELTGKEKVRLVYPKKWETRIFATVPDPWHQIAKLSVPYTVVRAEKSDVLTGKVWERWSSQSGSNKMIEMPDVGHLLPFEQPEKVAQLIAELIDSSDVDRSA